MTFVWELEADKRVSLFFKKAGDGPGVGEGSPGSTDLFSTAPSSPDRTTYPGISISTSPGGPTFIVPGPRTEDTGTGAGRVQMPQPVLFTPSINNASSIFEATTSESDDDNNLDLLVYEGYDSPPPANERLAELRNERRYRLLLEHEFHRSRQSFFVPVILFIFRSDGICISDSTTVDTDSRCRRGCWISVETYWTVHFLVQLV
jgi:hypothetical protein